MTNAGQRTPLPTIQSTGITVTASSSRLSNTLERTPNITRAVVITDSILRHIRDISSLGVYSELRQINKTDTRGLLHEDLRQQIRDIRPDFVYVHLGINDVHKGLSLKHTLHNILRFKKFMDTQWGTQTVFSLPLLTADPDANWRIKELREHITALVDEIDQHHPRSAAFKKVWINPNNNFIKDGRAIWENHSVDGTHLSNQGKDLILGNLRHQIHKMVKRCHPEAFYKRAQGSSVPHA